MVLALAGAWQRFATNWAIRSIPVKLYEARARLALGVDPRDTQDDTGVDDVSLVP
jgi:hypothetical protein